MKDQIVETIRRLKNQKPFEPFRIVTTSGEKVLVLDPFNMALAQTKLVCIDSATERTKMIDYSTVSGVEVFTPYVG